MQKQKQKQKQRGIRDSTRFDLTVITVLDADDVNVNKDADPQTNKGINGDGWLISLRRERQKPPDASKARQRIEL